MAHGLLYQELMGNYWRKKTMEHGMTMAQYEEERQKRMEELGYRSKRQRPDWVEPHIEQAEPVLSASIQSTDEDHWLHKKQPCSGGIAKSLCEELTWLPEDRDWVNPEHYKQLPKGVEVHEVLTAVANRDLGFTQHISYSDLCNCLKYLLRLGLKNGTLEELKKVQWYLNAIIEREEALHGREDQKTNTERYHTEVPDPGQQRTRPACDCGHRDKTGDDRATVYRSDDGDPDGLRGPDPTSVLDEQARYAGS